MTDIDYNTVVPFYCCSGGKKMDFNSLKFQFQSKNGSAFLEHQHRPKEFFSYCGIALSAKRGSMRGYALMNQILLKNNPSNVLCTVEEIKNSLVQFE